MTTLDASLPKMDRIQKYILVSISVHLLILAALSVRAAFFQSEGIAYEAAIKVDLVALPDREVKKIESLETRAAPQEKLTEEKKAEPASTPPPKQLVEKEFKKPIDQSSINLEKSKQKQKAALAKLKQMSALEEIEKEIRAENKKEAAAKTQQIKGNALSSGSELRGVAKLQHDNYIALIEKQIRQNWSLPEWLARKSLSAQVRVRFDENGNVISRDIAKSSGNPSFDDIVLAAVDRSSPVPAPPPKFAKILSHEGLLLGFPE